MRVASPPALNADFQLNESDSSDIKKGDHSNSFEIDVFSYKQFHGPNCMNSNAKEVFVDSLEEQLNCDLGCQAYFLLGVMTGNSRDLAIQWGAHSDRSGDILPRHIHTVASQGIC